MSAILNWVLEWWPWMLATFGVGGVIAIGAAFFLLGPAAAVVLLQNIAKSVGAFFAWVISYRIGCAIIAALVWGGAIDLWQRHYDEQACSAQIEELQQKAQAARKQRDADVAAEIAKTYEDVIAKLKGDNDELASKERDLEQKIKAVDAAPGSACQLGNDAIKLRKRK